VFYRDEINHFKTPSVAVILRRVGKSDAPAKQHFSIERNLRGDAEKIPTPAGGIYR